MYENRIIEGHIKYERRYFCLFEWNPSKRNPSKVPLKFCLRRLHIFECKWVVQKGVEMREINEKLPTI